MNAGLPYNNPMEWTYLDNNATTQPADEVVAAMHEVNTTLWGNPSSVHRFGQMVRQRVELARQQVAQLLGTRERYIIFTSGGTESNNLAVRGALDATRPSKPSNGDVSCSSPLLITTPVEHSALREPAQRLEQHGVRVITLPVDCDGRVSPSDLAATLSEHSQPRSLSIISIQWANNETGALQNMPAMVETVQSFRQSHEDCPVLLHTDATQAVGKIPVNVQDVAVDMLTCSAHKFHGPKGIGALYVRRGVRLASQNIGGPQERERRGGTENTAGIIGMGVAAERASAFIHDPSLRDQLGALRDQFERRIIEAVPDAVINGASLDSFDDGTPARLWNTSNIGFPRLEAEAILLGLSERGICASAGAACSSGSLEPSPVLLAMGIPEAIAHGSVRFSLSRFTTIHDIERALAAVPDVVRKLGKTLPVG